MTFAASLAYLERLGGELRPGAKFQLRTMRRLLAALDHPQRRFASVHVAGTNGKGSTAAFIEVAARHAGHRTGLYTSPHLERVTERIRIAGAEIGAARFAALATRVVAAARRLVEEGALPHLPSFFETLTAIGFLAFAEAGVELAVVEVGLGGRLDATNVLRPAVAVVTPIGLDHREWLGRSVAEIAAEKAGILKRGLGAAISAPQSPAARGVLRTRCRALGLRLEEVPAPRRLAVPVPLRGRHQRVNAAVALRACEALDRAGWPISAAALAQGFAAVEWPGRLERIGENPAVYLDGAHNPMAATALARFLKTMHPAPVLVFGCLRDKPARQLARRLFPAARRVVLTAPHSPRATPPAELRELTRGLAPCRVASDVTTALAAARRLARGGPIVVTGSLYLVGEARRALRAPQARRAGA